MFKRKVRKLECLFEERQLLNPLCCFADVLLHNEQDLLVAGHTRGCQVDGDAQ